jgi:TonB-linked SusC/RagA family outer membrane protein
MFMNLLKKLLVTLGVLLFVITAHAQSQKITGKVTGPGNEPLEGVTVKAKAVNKYATTLADGSFTIEVPQNVKILIFTYAGMETQEINILNRNNLQVKLTQDFSQLSDVVVVGYGTRKKADLTGSISSVDAKAIGERPVVTVNQALMGQMAGVNVELNDGTPGAVTSIRIRGTGSITAGNEPLYVIDGFPATQNEANTISPSDIETVTVLKDASSTAIYGSRAAGGVVLITTKSGGNMKPKIQFESSTGLAKVAKRDYYDVLNANEYVDYFNAVRNEQWVRDGNDPSVPIADRPIAYQIPEYVSKRDQSVNTDWQAAVMETALVQNQGLSVRGGNEKSKYYMSVGYVSDDGVIIGSNYQKFTARLRLDANLIQNKLTAGLNIAPSYSNRRVAVVGSGDVFSSVIGSALALPPITPIYNQDGSYATTFGIPGFNPFGNPVQLAKEVKNKTNLFSTIANTYLNLSVLNGLDIKTTLGVLFNNSTNDYYYPISMWRPFAAAPQYATASSSYGNTLNWSSETTVSYSKEFNNIHKINILGGFSAQKERSWGNSVSANKFSNDLVQTLNAGTVSAGTSSIQEWSLLSYYARANYSYADRYLLTATIRTDGSSRFGSNKRYGTFPSVAAAWKVSNEKFLSGLNAISNLKLRISFGITGNNNIGNYASIGLLGNINQTFGAGAGANNQGIYPINLSNPDLGWEKSTQTDVGIDLGLFSDRVTLVADYYNNRTSDLLLNVNIPTTTGFASSLQNIGEVENKGYEISVSTLNITNNTFSWKTTVNISHNQNKVIKLGPNGDPIYDFAGTRITAVGHEIGASSGLKVLGILTTKDIASGVAIFPGEQAGDPKYLDANNDGVISNFNGPDGVNLGNSMSKYTFGLTNIFTFKNFDFSIFAYGQTGGVSLDLLGQGLWASAGNNIFKSWLKKRYVSDDQPGDGMTPRLTFPLGGLPDTRLIQKTDFLRIANITLGYNLPVKKNSILSGFRAYIAVENAITWTGFNGYNPQVKSNAQSATLGGFTLGGGYPVPRIVSIGLNFSF